MTGTLSRREFAGGALALWMPASGRAEPLARPLLLSGRDAPASPSIPLRAGPVTAIFEPDIAFLRYVKYGDREILRGVYAAVRDKVWATVAPRVTNVVAEARADSFRVTFDAEHIEGEIDFGWEGVITGDAAGTIRFEFNGRSRSVFLKNRLGFAVLHPIKECAGKACTLEKPAGKREQGTFPDAIAPHQPFLDLRAISHEVAPGVTAEVRFEGELFETEDHRNWTDGNYKTYCTPLARPFPVQVERGQVVKQAVTIKLLGVPPGLGATPVKPLRIETAPGPAVKLPSIGYGLAADQATLTGGEIARLRALRPAHLRVDLRMWEADWSKTWERAVREAAALGAGIEAAVFLSGDGEAQLAALGGAAKPSAKVARWLVFHQVEPVTAAKWAPLARRHLRGAPLVLGTNQYFTELNRARPAVDSLDASCYSLNPQVHAFDNQSLVENLEGQAATVRTAKTFLGAKPVCVTPVTLRPRFNPQAKGARETVLPGRLPGRIDARQMSLFGAAWTLGSVKYLAENGAASVTYYETHGWAGVMETAKGPAVPALFPSIAGAVFPLYHVLAEVAEFAGGSAQAQTSSDPLLACALALESGPRRRLLVANLTAEPRIVTVAAAWLGPRARVAMLDEQNAEDAMRSPERFRGRAASLMEAAGGEYRLAMLPYGVARLDK